jgi:polyisoprenoid-binding protein YceI
MIAPDSSVSARVAFFGLASKTARFPKVSGEITLDPAKLDSIGLTVTMDARALTAGDRVTLERLKGPAFFDVGRHPTITFTGRDMRLTGARTAEVSGQLTARGVTRPVRLNVVFAADPRSAGKAPLRLTGRTTIDRRDFGMTAYSVVVGRKVTITLDVRVTPG